MIALRGARHRESYLDIVMIGIVGAFLALAIVIVLGTAFGSFEYRGSGRKDGDRRIWKMNGRVYN
jgi:formate hydrogenlyase subunit 3/multisubunit Na+/H+ antiporter MnhD subunit